MGSLGWLCVGIYVFLSTYVNAGSFFFFVISVSEDKYSLSKNVCAELPYFVRICVSVLLSRLSYLL